MSMVVLNMQPPLFDEIAAALPLARTPGIIFAWGAAIYNPSGAPISPHLHAHEEVHGKRQGNDVEGWWRRYIADASFRLDEEIPAHQAEYREFCRLNTAGQARNHRRLALHAIAKKLAAPLYGNLIRYDDARKLLKEAHAA